MLLKNRWSHKFVLAIAAVFILVLYLFLFYIPPALFPDPAMGFQVLRSMHMGSGFNTFISPDQSDISQNYSEFLTWWSPGQYLVPHLVQSIFNINLGQAIGLTVMFCQLSGIAGLYFFYKKAGFSPMITTLSLIFIIGQQAFFVPFVFYNGGEILLFAFEGWFLYGCISISKITVTEVLFILGFGLLGFFLKSSFIWIYCAGLFCLWVRSSGDKHRTWNALKNGLWIALPGVFSLLAIYIFYISKGQTPVSASTGIKFTAETFAFPLASPLVSAFSVDDLLHGILFHVGTPLISAGWSVAVILLFALLSLLLMISIIIYVPNKNYRLFLVVFYLAAVLFFGIAYLKQLTISYEARHFRLLGILIVPGLIYMISKFARVFKLIFCLVFIGITFLSITYVVKGFRLNHNMSARGITGIAQPSIDQAALNNIMELDKKNRNAVFVFTADDIGLEIEHNRIITLPPIGADLKVNADDYRYDGHAGPLYIVLPETYVGPKEKLIMKSFPGYQGFNITMLSNNYVLYSAK